MARGANVSRIQEFPVGAKRRTIVVDRCLRLGKNTREASCCFLIRLFYSYFPPVILLFVIFQGRESHSRDGELAGQGQGGVVRIPADSLSSIPNAPTNVERKTVIEAGCSWPGPSWCAFSFPKV